jgi:uncharacterized protein YidB (DUF937 family)
MELNDLLKMGAALIEGNKDDATTGLDIDTVAKALKGIIMNSDGTLDLAAIVGNLSKNGLGEIVGSWLGNSENKAMVPDDVAVLLGEDKIDAFARELGIDKESAKQALADALPEVVDKATSDENSIIDQMVGGSGNPMEILSKMFR